MYKNSIMKWVIVTCITSGFWACTPSVTQKTINKSVPANYTTSEDSVNTTQISWRNIFADSNLNALVDTALKNNQELNIMLEEINISQNEIRTRKGEYLPFLNIGAGAGVEKVGRYTRNGAVDESTDIEPGKRIPENLPDFLLAANISWEVDIWKKLRNAKKAAVYRYLSTVEGKNFMVTNLFAEISNSYFELMALDNQLEILKNNIEIQQNALKIVKLQKQAAKVTELAVRRFEAQVLNTESLQYTIQQKITETENKINYLVGRFPQPVIRSSQSFIDLVPDSIQAGVPSQLLENRLDIKQAELELEAAKLDVKVAKANFYPSFRINAGLGYQAFNPKFLINTPESILYSVAGELIAPVINRNAIKAAYLSANAKQIQAIYNYERTVLRAYTEVANQLAMISNLEKSYDLKDKQVKALTESVHISNVLFSSARADYMEVLLTQRDALESKMELIETKKLQLNAMVNTYRALGGGWK